MASLAVLYVVGIKDAVGIDPGIVDSLLALCSGPLAGDCVGVGIECDTLVHIGHVIPCHLLPGF